MKLKIRRFHKYRTRGGEEVSLFIIREGNYYYPAIDGSGRSWQLNGSVFISEECEDDLIEDLGPVDILTVALEALEYIDSYTSELHIKQKTEESIEKIKEIMK